MNGLHHRPHPPRRLPRVLPTPPRPEPAAAPRLRHSAGLHRTVYDEAFYALTHSGTRPMDELSAATVALAIARRVLARYESERR